MSSTNRGGMRVKSDYYKTPVKDIEVFLQAVIEDIPDFVRPYYLVLDPATGGDDYTSPSYPEALSNFGLSKEKITTVDIREDSKALIKGDYLATTFDYKFYLTITNPPFILALPFIEKALQFDTMEGGYVAMLLRLNFFGSYSRLDFWHKYMPIRIYVHHNRISFTGGATDSVEYMHAVWRVGDYPRETLLRVI